MAASVALELAAGKIAVTALARTAVVVEKVVTTMDAADVVAAPLREEGMITPDMAALKADRSLKGRHR